VPDPTFPLLFTPITLRGLTVRNRVWLSPMCQYAIDAQDGVPTQWQLVHLGARAQGGFGVVFTEATAVSPEGRISPQDTGIWNDEQAAAWAPIVRFVRSQGAAAGIQLAHAGRKASSHRGFPGEAVGPVPDEDGGWPPRGPGTQSFPRLREPHAMSHAELAEAVDDFASATRRALDAEFDLVEVHAAHGYLLHEFLSPLSNTRTDEYGGDRAARARFPLEVVDAVRGAWPDSRPLTVRISGTDWTDGGWDVEDSVWLAERLTEHGVDLVDVSSGGNVPAQIPVGPGYQVPLAARVRESGATTAAVGLITDPAQAEQILRDGQADVVLLARAALREPGWPWRAASELGLAREETPYPPNYLRGAWRP
jgi:2,4-dienoyl-CoA reductase-like NADH-dependent reductase (Old Yellow Enzyme family)